ncbi:MAG: type II toxin-antitoxin system VapC family toxin [Geminicoccaceae bacterium]
MTATLIDSNVLIDVATGDQKWAAWSEAALASTADMGRLVINPIVYAEVSVAYERIEQLETALPRAMFGREDLPWEAGFLAGKAFVAYRRRGGVKRSTLRDFYIGAHAAIRGYRLLTRDIRRYRNAFPSVEILASQG